MLGKSAQVVQNALNSQGISSKVMELPASTRTADDAATAIGCSVAQIIKSLIFRTTETDKPVLILVSGRNRVDETLIAFEVGEAIIKADAEYTRQKTGFAIGGVPPVGHKQFLETYIDKDLLLYREVWAAAGTPNAVFRLDSAHIERLTKGRVISIHH